MTDPDPLSRLPESLLRVKLLAAASCERRTTASLLAYLAEFDRRELWAQEGVSSTFAYCTERLHMSESAACKRIWVARLGRKYPEIFSAIAEGRLHLSAVMAVRTLLTDANCHSVLGRIEHKSKREIERIVAELTPRPDVPSRVRVLPPRSTEGVPQPLLRRAETSNDLTTHCESSPDLHRHEGSDSTLAPEISSGRDLAGLARHHVSRGVVRVLSPKRYQITVTVSEEAHATLTALQDLLAPKNPNGYVEYS